MSKRRILIADDDQDIRDLLRLFLDPMDAVVDEAEDGADAICKACRLEPDIVVMDYSMPVLDGASAAKVVRRILPGVLIVACSAVITSKPPWADLHVNKTAMSTLPRVLTEGIA